MKSDAFVGATLAVAHGQGQARPLQTNELSFLKDQLRKQLYEPVGDSAGESYI